jgi:uncharacterized membrane protein
VSPEIQTFLLAMTPVGELRVSIPVALTVYQLPVWSAYFFSVLGNLVPLILIISLLGPISEFFSQRINFCQGFFNWLFSHTRSANQSKFEKLGKNLAVVILVATPIPFIGGWTGAIAAFVFGIPFKKALPLVIVGSSLAGLIVTLATLGIFNFLEILRV